MSITYEEKVMRVNCQLCGNLHRITLSTKYRRGFSADFNSKIVEYPYFYRCPKTPEPNNRMEVTIPFESSRAKEFIQAEITNVEVIEQ
jgi:hypothetical protein